MASGSFFLRIKLSIVTPLKTSTSEVASSVLHCLNHHHHTCRPTWILPGFPIVDQPTRPTVLSSAVHLLQSDTSQTTRDCNPHLKHTSFHYLAPYSTIWHRIPPYGTRFHHMAPSSGYGNTAQDKRCMALSSGYGNTAQDKRCMALSSGYGNTAQDKRCMAPSSGYGNTAQDKRWKRYIRMHISDSLILFPKDQIISFIQLHYKAYQLATLRGIL